MKIYINNDCCCHTSPAEGLREFDVPFFEGKCPALVEGYRYVPQGETWTRSDGVEFKGEMIAPFVDSRILEAYQAQYETGAAEREDMQAALALLGVE